MTIALGIVSTLLLVAIFIAAIYRSAWRGALGHWHDARGNIDELEADVKRLKESGRKMLDENAQLVRTNTTLRERIHFLRDSLNEKQRTVSPVEQVLDVASRIGHWAVKSL